MATENLATRIQWAAATVDGVAAIVKEFIQSTDLDISRQAHACEVLLSHISDNLDGMAMELEQVGNS